MKYFYTLLTYFFLVGCLIAQTKIDTINSKKLDAERELKIQLPRNYNPESELKYPILIVLDGDYLFEPIAGNIDYQSYWENMPDCIIVGVNQKATKTNDLSYSDNNTNFYDFIGAELLPYIESKYKSSKFRIIVGHGLGATFINHFILKKASLFRAYIALSPNLDVQYHNNLKNKLASLGEETFYYLATGNEDKSEHKISITQLNTSLASIKNEKLYYKYNAFEDANHLSLVGRGISKALKDIFSTYKPIDTKEYKEKILTYDGSPFDYLMNKYENIEYFYGFKKKIIENDLRAISSACKSKDDAEAMGKLANYVKKEFPDSMLGAYYMGMYHENYGSLKKALISYKSGLALNPSQFIDKELMLEKMYQIERELKN